MRFQNPDEEQSQVERFVGNLDIPNHIRGREAFLGGRTNALSLYYEVKEGERIEYADFYSLYPYTNMTSRFPVGHPTFVTKDFIAKPIDYFGIIKCDVLPSRRLYIPVPPFRVNNKLMFPLCSKCAETMNQDKYHHSVNERQLTGVWCTPELEKAEEAGYCITKVYEVWHYDESATYNPKTGEGGLFTEYINMFLKIKQESSDYPEWCRTEEDQTIYIQRYHEKEGIVLERSMITTNPGLRALAKLNLNSFWGKLGQRSNFRQSTYVETAAKLLKMLIHSTKDVTDLSFVSDEMVLVQHYDKEDYITEAPNMNAVLAAMTTNYA
ncbi:uncharacterized protein LOC144343177 [Saccoglossus kowalevskii]